MVIEAVDFFVLIVRGKNNLTQSLWRAHLRRGKNIRTENVLSTEQETRKTQRDIDHEAKNTHEAQTVKNSHRDRYHLPTVRSWPDHCYTLQERLSRHHNVTHRTRSRQIRINIQPCPIYCTCSRSAFHFLSIGLNLSFLRICDRKMKHNYFVSR